MPHDRRLSQYSQAPPCRTPIFPTEDTWNAQAPSADPTSARRLERPDVHVTHDMHGPSQVETIFLEMHLTVYIGSFNTLSCVPLSSFRPRLPTLYASFPSFTLAFCHRTSPHPHRPCTHRLALGYNSLSIRTLTLLSTSPRGSDASKIAYTFFPFLSFSPFLTLFARSVLVLTASDLRINTSSPGLVRGRLLRVHHFLTFSFCFCVHVRARPFDDQPSRCAINRLFGLAHVPTPYSHRF